LHNIDLVAQNIIDLPPDWHLSGSVSRNILKGITKHALNIGPIDNTVETGSGKTTLLFSHLSGNHLVFALEGENRSISAVRQSDLFNPKTVTFIEGPTQKTLPQYEFSDPLSIALIDGPHCYPFPDLEYYYFYPKLREGGLLLLDDIQIPTIRRMFDIIKADRMFDLIDIRDYMAFFRRTDVRTINPFGDGWGDQGYNSAYWKEMQQVEKKVRVLEKIVPQSVRERIPNPVKRWILRIL